MNRRTVGMMAAVMAVAGLAFVARAEPMIPANIAAAVADPSRPADDVSRDALRKPGAMLAFAQVAPGQRIGELIPGKGGEGYFTRLFSAAVGPTGVVYAFTPAEFAHFSKTPLPPSGTHLDPARPNVVFETGPVNDFAMPQALDLVWTSQNYHDLHDSFAQPADLAKVNAAIFKALKPGGLYVVLDHAALPGSGLSATETLHRIDPAVVRAEVEAAGFKFDGESDVLHNPDDPHTAKVFDPSIRGKTDQFVFRFRKPA